MTDTDQTARILILGGTTEGYALADALADDAGLHVINSLAGRTADPRLPTGETRIGGFGGVAGLADFLRERLVTAVIDATHPFAATMGWHAAEACRTTGIPLLRLERPGWTAGPGDRWERVDDWEAAGTTLRRLGARRVLLALGRQELAPFAGLDGIWFLIRLVTPPNPMPPFGAAEVLLSRGPFDLATERALLEEHGIDAIVCKNSGGEATVAKLVAARERGIPVVMRRRPARPEISTASSVAEALGWLDRVRADAN